MHRKSTAARIAAFIGGLVLLGSSMLVHAPAISGATSTTPLAGSLEAAGSRLQTAGSRGRVVLRDAAKHSKVRPGIHSLPAIHPSTMPAAPGAKRPKVVSAAPPVQSTATAGAAAAVTGFAGVSANTTNEANIEPPDPFLAVGPDSVVQMVNLLARVTDRNGASLAPDITLGDFFLLPNDGNFADTDPRVVYDSLHSRWIATEASWDCSPNLAPVPPDQVAHIGHGYLDVAISDTADPTGTWQVYFRTYWDQFPDYPGLGTSTDKVALSANVFAMTAPTPGQLDCIGTSSTGADTTVFDWTDLANGGDLHFRSIAPFTSPLFTLRPAVQSPATSPDMYWVAYTPNSAPGWDEVQGRITGSVGAGTIASTGTNLSGLMTTPIAPDAPNQPGPATIADAVDERITDAIWQANKLTWVATYKCTPSGDSSSRDCVRVSQLATTTVPTLLQDFLVAQNGKDFYMGGIGVTGNGALHVVWSRSSATAGDFPTTLGAYQLPSDPANSLSAPQVLAQGTATYLGTRWGDYVGVPQDPQDPNAVWQADEYSTTPTGGNWNTRVTQMVTGTGSTYVPIAPVRVLNTIAGVGLTGRFTANVPRTFQVAGTPGIPANAKAVTANLAVTQQTAAGFVTLSAAATSSPSTSTINFPLGDVRANNVTLPLSATGMLSAVYKAGPGKTTHLVLDVTGYFLDDDTGATYHTITPFRLLSTPSGTGLAGKFLTGVSRTFQVTGVIGSGIPVGAVAISGNLTVTKQTSAGFVSVTPDPVAVPTTSNLNFPVGDNRANGLTVQLNGAGELSAIYIGATGSSTDLILDVTGYYNADLTGLHFFPLNPGRRLNSLGGTPGITIFHSSVPQSLEIDRHDGVPAGAAAITGNLTVTQQTQAGYVSITPDPTASPATSTINFPAGDNRANGVTAPVSTITPGFMSFVYKAGTARTVQLILDVTGYFK